MALADSLLSAIVRADGDALVMHVGERPYVVVGTQTINISTHGLNLDAMTGMLAQLLPADAHMQLEEFGAVEHRLPPQGGDRFTVVAARGGDDIWIEIRRRRAQPVVAAAPIAEPAPVAIAPEPAVAHAAIAAPAAVEPAVEMPAAADPVVEPEPVADIVVPEPLVVVNAPLEPIEVATLETAEPDELLSELEAYAEPAPIVAEQPAVVEPPLLPEELEVLEAPAIVEEPTIAAEPEIAIETIAAEAATPIEDPIVATEPEPAVVEEPVVPEVPAVIAEPMVAEAPIAEPIFVEPVSEPRIEVHEPEPMPAAASIAHGLEPEALPTSATVLPMTRTVRIEVPPRTAAASRTTDIDRLLRIAAARGASALFLTSDSRPWIRVEGDLRHLESEAPLSRVDVESAILEIAPESGHESIGKGEPTEWIAEFADVGRIRCSTFSDHRGPGMLLRMIATRAATAEQLGLAREVQALATEPQGLVLVAGPRAGGKSTLMSALVDLVNRQRAEFVITLERQIRLVHDNKLALVSQREIRGGAEDSVAAARAALRENPDVMVIDDLVSSHMVPLLLTAASEGLLVFVSITAPSTTDAVQRFVELAPPEMRKAVQNAMAESFRGAVAQALLKKAGGGLVAAREVLLATAPVARVIGEGQLGQLPLALDSGRKHGMVSFTDALVDYVRSGTVDVREAFRKAPDRNRLLDSLKRDGIDTSVVERLA